MPFLKQTISMLRQGRRAGRLLALLALGLLGFAVAAPVAAGPPAATVYKDPNCGCCQGYAEHLERAGFKVTVVNTSDLPEIKKKHAVPEALESCHTTLVGGYVVEGHVPISAVERLLSEKPAIKGIGMPGMPAGSPGMGGAKSEPFVVYELSPAKKIYAVE